MFVSEFLELLHVTELMTKHLLDFEYSVHKHVLSNFLFNTASPFSLLCCTITGKQGKGGNKNLKEPPFLVRICRPGISSLRGQGHFHFAFLIMVYMYMYCRGGGECPKLLKGHQGQDQGNRGHM